MTPDTIPTITPTRRRRVGSIGQPTKLTPERQEAICNSIRAQGGMEAAARANGIGVSTLHDWVARGYNPTEDRPDTDGIYSDFVEAIEKARGEHEQRASLIIEKAAQDPRYWTAAAWKLERLYPDRWGKVEHRRVELTGAHGGPLEMQVEQVSEADRARLVLAALSDAGVIDLEAEEVIE